MNDCTIKVITVNKIVYSFLHPIHPLVLRDSLSLSHVIWKIAGNSRCVFLFCCNCNVLWMSTESKTRMTYKGRIYRFMFNCNNSLFSRLRLSYTTLWVLCLSLEVSAVYCAFFEGGLRWANMNHANSFDDITLCAKQSDFSCLDLKAFPFYCLIVQHFRIESCFNGTICYALLIIVYIGWNWLRNTEMWLKTKIDWIFFLNLKKKSVKFAWKLHFLSDSWWLKYIKQKIIISFELYWFNLGWSLKKCS